MTYTEEMTTSEILLRLASVRNDLLQAVNDIEKISKNICYKAEQTESCSEKPNNCELKICDTCRYYNSDIPCGSTPSACKEADKFAEEFVDGLKKLKPTISKMEQVEDEPMKTADYCDICKRDMCEDCIADATNPYCVPSHYEINYEPKDEPQTERSE